MKFRVAREDLADAVAWVAKSLPSRPPVPVLGGILLEVDGSTLVVAGFDYEVSTRAEVSVDAESGGRVLVSGRLLAEITRALPSSKPVDIAAEGSRVTISGGSARFTLPTMPVEDYPPLPEMPAASGKVDASAFAAAVTQTAVARRPRRHPPDADRRPRRDRGREAHAGRDRSLPARRPRVVLDAGRPRHVDRRFSSRPGPWPTRRRAWADPTRSSSVSVTGCSACRPAAAAPPSGCSTSNSSSTGRCCPASTRPRSTSRSASSARPSSASPWSPTVAITCACRSPTEC